MDTNLTKGFPGSLFKVLSSYDENRFNFCLPQLTWGVAALVGLTVEQDCNEESDSDKEDEEYSDTNDNSFEESYMESKEVFDNVKIDIITGDKDGLYLTWCISSLSTIPPRLKRSGSFLT